ncbi:NAD-dependent epimerase/dehydratase family protein [Paenibacillus thalictri]|uniref:NAD(P)-dependent oxidoreductase n=1 Tax=Paenibacillus thalictri TaxID=2527873 RepID=A0A4Q9DK97_9BACL|nr:NAD(P)-dependent oxidoreductase [Paenibacillus thalictri]TBL75164.1 NAD(P)-dependent oxidoreductase [Paenibacillus thalictri]
MRKILITGAAGMVGKCIYLGLQDDPDYEVIGTDIQPDPSLGIEMMDVTDFESCLHWMKGVDTVIHMAYRMNHPSLADAFQVNYLGTHHIYEAAKECGVGRVIFGSSNHTVGRYLTDETVDADSLYRPSNLYGLSKCHGELMGRLYSDKCGISSINVRIGTFFGVPPKSERHLKTWISRRDLVQLMKCCVEADAQLKFLTLFGISNNRDKYWDIAYLKELIGYNPQDDGAAYEGDIDPDQANPDELVYQGGIGAHRPAVY